MTISVFGNPVYEDDALLVRMLPQLRKAFPQHKFIHQDPTENIIIPKDEWVILDVAQGIDKITVFNNLDQFESTRSVSVHDYDLFLELKLQEKLNKLPKLKIITVPIDINQDIILKKLAKLLIS